MFHRLSTLVALLVVASAADAGARRPIEALDLVGIRDIGGHHRGAMAISPDGNYMAFQLQTPSIEKRNYALTWYVGMTRPRGEVWPAGDGGELILNPSLKSTTNGNRPPVAPVWSPDGQWIFYLKRIGGDTQIWRSHRDGNIQEQLTHSNRDVLASPYDHTTPPSFKLIEEGKTILFSVAKDSAIVYQRLMDEGDRGYLFDDRFRPARNATPFLRTCGYNSWGRPEEVKIERACDPQVRAYDVDTRVERAATEDEIVTYFSSASAPPFLLGRDVRSLHRSTNKNTMIWLENENPRAFPGSTAPVRLFASVEGNEYRCAAELCKAYGGVIEGIWFRPNSGEIIFQRADGSNKSMTGLYAWTPASNHVRIILQTEDKLDGCEIFENHAICLREQWTHPRTIISLKLDSGEIKTIYDPNPEFEDIKFSKIEKIEWEDSFGGATHGHLVYPLHYQEGRRYPVVIVTYRSRGVLRGGIGDEYPIHLLAAHGFMVLSHDKSRSFHRFAKIADPVRANFEDLYERYSSFSAQEHILELLSQRGLIDLKRTAITGLSDGEDQVRFALIHSDRFTTAIASGAFDYIAHYYMTNRNWRAYWENLFGGPPDQDEHGHWLAHSLGRNARKVDVPVLVNVSDDELLPSLDTFTRLKDAGRVIEMYVYPGEHHVKWQPQHRLAIYRRNVQWLRFWLKGEEANVPVDPGQYSRWRKMRDERCAGENAGTPIYCKDLDL